MSDTNSSPRSLADLGNAARLRGDLTLGSTLLDEALKAARPADRAYVLGAVAALRITQRRFSAARSLLQEAKALEARAGNTVGRVRVALQLGLIAEHEGDPAEVLPGLADALAWCRRRLVASGGADHEGGRLAFAAAQSIAHRLLDLGQATEAAQMARAARLLSSFAVVADRLKLDWLIARIEVATGDSGAAEQRLRDLRPNLVAAGVSPLDCALVCLDQAILAAQRDDAKTVKRLAFEALGLASRSEREFTAESVAALALQRLASGRASAAAAVVHAACALRLLRAL